MSLREVNLHSTYDTYAMIADCFKALTWVATIVAGYLVLEWVNDNNDDDPECPA